MPIITAPPIVIPAPVTWPYWVTIDDVLERMRIVDGTIRLGGANDRLPIVTPHAVTRRIVKAQSIVQSDLISAGLVPPADIAAFADLPQSTQDALAEEVLNVACAQLAGDVTHTASNAPQAHKDRWDKEHADWLTRIARPGFGLEGLYRRADVAANTVASAFVGPRRTYTRENNPGGFDRQTPLPDRWPEDVGTFSKVPPDTT